MVAGESFEVITMPGSQFSGLAELQGELIAVFKDEMIGILFDLLERKELIVDNQQLIINSGVEERRSG